MILLTLVQVTVFSQDGEIFQGTHQRNETVPIVFAFAAIRQDGVTVAVAEKIDPEQAKKTYFGTYSTSSFLQKPIKIPKTIAIATEKLLTTLEVKG